MTTLRLNLFYLLNLGFLGLVFLCLFFYQFLLISYVSFFQFLFVFFQFNLILSAWFVIFNFNPVYSVLFLVLVFFNATFLLLFLRLDFLAFILVIVYIGAIAVLFLFVVMMLNIRVLQFAFSSYAYFSLGVLILFFFFMFLYTNLSVENGALRIGNFLYSNFDLFNWLDLLFVSPNVLNFGYLIYGVFVFDFFLSLICLLIALLGAISLAFNQSFKLRKQIVYEQLVKTFSVQLDVKRNILK